jgi:DNA invertase Pin-like site-specific DNA recombinase
LLDSSLLPGVMPFPFFGGASVAARLEGWALHFADLDIDTSTPAGEMAANIISGSQYERRLISQRTRDALAANTAAGAPSDQEVIVQRS